MFTDIEGSVRLWQRVGATFADALSRHNAIIGECAIAHEAQGIKPLGDGFMLRFQAPAQAIRCGLRIQERLRDVTWPEGIDSFRVRIAVHAGELHHVGAMDYVGQAVNLAHRVMQAASGGQVLVSEAAAKLALPEVAADVRLVDLGAHLLRDILQPVGLMLAIPAGAPVPEFIPVRSVDALPTNLPAEVDDLIGREADLVRIQGILERPGARLITIAGPGGVGKTRLLQKVGLLSLDSYQDGVWMVQLAHLTHPEQVPAAIAAEFHVRADGPEETMASLGAFLARKGLLLLLDNYEHLMDAALVPTRLLEAAPHITCIVTSRERLQVRGEHVVELRPLSLPEVEDSVETLWGSESVQLFVRRGDLPAEQGNLAEEDARTVACICRRLDGLPLAIELAAACLSQMTLAELLASLNDDGDVPKTNLRDLPARHRSIRATLDWSRRLLPEEQAAVLAKVAIFRGGFFGPAAEAVCAGDVRDEIEDLRGKSLLQGDPVLGQTRYSMLPLVREYALECLGEGQEECQARAARHFAAVCDSLDLRGQIRDLQVVRLELDNVRAALSWAQAHGEAPIITVITATVWPVFAFSGQREEAELWLSRSIEACRERGDEETLAVMLLRLAVCRKAAATGAALALLAESISLSERLGLEATRLWAQLERGVVWHAAGELTRAQSALEDLLAAYRAAGDVWGIVESLRALARVAASRAAWDEGERCIEEALAMEDPETRTWGVSNSYKELGGLRLARREHPGAMAAFRESIRLSRQVDDRPALVERLVGFAQAALGAGEPASAHDACQEALVLARRHCPGLVDTITRLMGSTAP